MFGGQSGGFSFGGTTQTPQTTTSGSTSGFSFGAPAGGTTGFSFGGTGTTTATATAAATAPAPAGGFTFNKPPTTSAGATTAAPGGFSFAQAPTTTAGFSFGGGNGNTGFGFGTAATTTSAQPPSAPVSSTANTLNLTLGQSQPVQQASVGFGMGTSATTTSAAPAGFGLLGTTAPTTTTTATPTMSSLGFAVSSTPTVSFNLSTPASTAAAAAPGGFGVGTATSAPGVLGTSTATSTGGVFGTSSVSLGLSTSTPASTGFSLAGGLKAGFAAASTATSTPSTPSTAGFGLGGAATTKTAGFGLSLGMPSSTAAATVTSSISQGKQMTYRQLEESINKWMAELEEQEQTFLQQATQVNAWDRLVMENGEKIIQLNKEVERVKMDQQKLDHELDFIHAQQRELKELLTPLEKELDQLPSISYQQHADLEREHTYQLAENLDAQLKRMGQDLKEIIERLNATSATTDPQDPIQQLTKILNAHMDSLLWIDRNTVALNRKMEEIGKQMDSQRTEQERNFRMAYNYVNK